jgi:hypothetical protein
LHADSSVEITRLGTVAAKPAARQEKDLFDAVRGSLRLPFGICDQGSAHEVGVHRGPKIEA